jgi:hypothetical protein
MKRKIFVMSVCLACFGMTLNAQDIIMKKNGDEIRAKITEINTDNVKYRKFDNLEGPVHTLLRSEIFMIKYENGDKDIIGNEPPVTGKQNSVSGGLQQPGAAVRQPQEFDRRVRFGIKAGFHAATVELSSGHTSEEMDEVPGAVAGATLYTPFAPRWGLHTGLEASMKGFKIGLLSFRAIYLQAPVEVGFKIRLGNGGWYFEPRSGLYFAYGIAGKITASGASESLNTFGDEILKPFDVGGNVGFHFGNDRVDIGLRGELGFVDITGDPFADYMFIMGVVNTSMITSNFGIVVGFKF